MEYDLSLKRPNSLTQCACLGFVTKRVNDLRRGSNESDSGLLDFAGEFGILGEETIAVEDESENARARNVAVCAPRVDHVNTVLKRDTNDIILRKVSSNRCQALADLVCFIGLVTPKIQQ